MTEPAHNTAPHANVGDDVHIRRSDGSAVSGTLIEDFADYVLSGDEVGRDWAMPRRWAVETDEGTLIFIDDADIIDHGGVRTARQSHGRDPEPAVKG